MPSCETMEVSTGALDPACTCEACTLYSRSYLHHLVKCREPLGWQLLAFHNLSFYLRLMAEIRAQLERGTFARFHAEQRVQLALVDQDNPPARGPRRRIGKPSTRGAFAVVTGETYSALVRIGEPLPGDPDARATRLLERSLRLAALVRGEPRVERVPESRSLVPDERPLVIWDIGLGAAHVAMALVRQLDGTEHAPVELVSFERDLDGFRLALDHQKEFAHLRHPAPHILARSGAYRRDGFVWTVCEGDIAETHVGRPRPDLVLYGLRSSAILAQLALGDAEVLHEVPS